MGTHRKISASVAPKAEEIIDVEELELFEQMESRLGTQLSRLEETSEMVHASMRQGEAAPQLVREEAGLARAMATLSGEIRAIEKHGRDRVSKMTPEEQDRRVYQYSKTLTRARRDAIRELFDEMDKDEGGVLGL